MMKMMIKKMMIKMKMIKMKMMIKKIIRNLQSFSSHWLNWLNNLLHHLKGCRVNNNRINLFHFLRVRVRIQSYK